VVAAGPAGPRRRLGADLRRLRAGVGLHLDEVAQVLGCSTSKVSRLETGKGVPKASDVRRLIRLYGVSAEAEQETLLQLVRDSRAEGWWTTYTEGVEVDRFFLDGADRYVALETDATGVRSFDYGILHGLLQTAEYARAVLSLQLPHHAADAIDQLVELREKRQEALHRPNPLELTAVVDESGLVRTVGGPDVMAIQMRHLLELMQLPNVTIRVLPFASGLLRAHLGHFMILEIPPALGSDLVYIEGHAGATYLEDQSDVDLYADVFADALARSLEPGESAELVRERAHDHAPRKAPQ
jgi:transcriptional regulator with XRE-family HTH domain